jgi:hypothetical protein
MKKRDGYKPPSQQQAVRLPQIVGSELAPMIYADGCISFGVLNGTIQLELGANILIPLSDGSGNTLTKTKVVGHLRLTPRGAQTLIDGIRGASSLLKAEHERVQAEREKMRAAAKPAAPPLPAKVPDEQAA